MPKWLHDKLARQANKKGLTGDRRGAYVFGTLAQYKKKKKERKDLGGGFGRGLH